MLSHKLSEEGREGEGRFEKEGTTLHASITAEFAAKVVSSAYPQLSEASGLKKTQPVVWLGKNRRNILQIFANNFPSLKQPPVFNCSKKVFSAEVSKGEEKRAERECNSKESLRRKQGGKKKDPPCSVSSSPFLLSVCPSPRRRRDNNRVSQLDTGQGRRRKAPLSFVVAAAYVAAELGKALREEGGKR